MKRNANLNTIRSIIAAVSWGKGWFVDIGIGGDWLFAKRGSKQPGVAGSRLGSTTKLFCNDFLERIEHVDRIIRPFLSQVVGH